MSRYVKDRDTLTAREERTRFIFGMGAQKSGTTWTARYLSNHPQVYLYPIKEMNVLNYFFPGVEDPDKPARHAPDLKAIQDRIAALRLDPQADPSEIGKLLRRANQFDRIFAMRSDLNLYIDHFRQAIAKNPAVVALGEISPEYAWLSATQLVETRALMSDAGFDIRPIFIMRDPVDRIVSWFGHMQRRQFRTGQPPITFDHHTALETAKSPEYLRYSLYEKTLESLDASFPEEEMLITFYEHHISESGISTMCDFLGIDQIPPPIHEGTNVGVHKVTLELRTLQALREFYEPTYRATVDRLGEFRVRAAWRNYDEVQESRYVPPHTVKPVKGGAKSSARPRNRRQNP